MATAFRKDPLKVVPYTYVSGRVEYRLRNIRKGCFDTNAYGGIRIFKTEAGAKRALRELINLGVAIEAA